MKRISLLISAIFTVCISSAQVKTPQPSPAATIKQTVGMTDITIEYSRPGVKGRKIFGELVPYGQVWRTGANKAVQFQTSTKVTIQGKELPAGKYALFTVPNADSWDIVFYEETEIWGTPEKWVDSLEAVMVTVKTTALTDVVESFTISLDDVSNGNAVLMSISWEKTKVSLKLDLPTEEISMESIKTTMAGPTANDYYRAASFYHDNGKDLTEALAWAKKAVELRGEDAFWMLRKQSLIEADLGDKKAAIATAKRSLASAQKAKNDDYIRMNEASIAEWSK